MIATTSTLPMGAGTSDRPHRFAPFAVVGLIGFGVQLGALHLLTTRAGWPWLAATLVAVELAIVHNFLWHERWTWSDRTAGPAARGARASLGRFGRFHLANGLVSIAGNALVMAWLAGVLGMPPVPANAIAVGATSVVNYLFADKWVFRKRSSVGRAPRAIYRSAPATGVALALVLAGAASTGVGAASLGPQDQPQTVAAWERYVAETEAKLAGASPLVPREGQQAAGTIDADGESIHIPGGTISDWRGAVFIPHMTLDRLLYRLQHPGTPPPQEDVVSSRVIARGQDSLRVGIRLVRRTIVTVSYDTEHEMQFRRLSPVLATARSVATRIDQVDGGDHGFLWRLHSYWRYQETGGGVRVELRSLTLSRNVPALVRPIAGPIVSRVARESMVRTLEALRKYFGTPEGVPFVGGAAL